jgi:hypothetical protein
LMDILIINEYKYLGILMNKKLNIYRLHK